MSALAGATLASGFLASAERMPERPALVIDGTVVTYDALRRRAAAIAGTLVAETAAEPPLTAVFASRTADSYAGVLAALFRGHGYLPLDPRFPPARNREILERSGCCAVVVDRASADAARAALDGLRPPLVVVLCAAGPARGWAPHTAVPVQESAVPPDVAVGEDLPAYLLFTSGSTGRPKGVLVRQRNVRAFLDAVGERYDLDEDDRFSQLFDLTFDLSAFDLFAAWEHGACVHVPPDGARLDPSSYIRSAGLTVWFSVPSAAMFMRRFRTLKPGAFPTLRLSLFCGEALPTALADAWAAAAPNSRVENLYGPTEATIACTAHRFEADEDGALVPIGTPLGATEARVVDELLRPVRAGEPGELVVAGPQVVDGYFDDEAATARAFVELPALGRAYRTGDRVVADGDGTLRFLGRLDTQIKVLGHRVELEEVEAAIAREAGAEAIAVGWPRTETGAGGLVALVAGHVDASALRAGLAARLPEYMIPREIRVVDELPKNANGKRDRRAAEALLEER